MPIKNINTLQNYEDLKYTTEIARQLNNDNNGDNAGVLDTDYYIHALANLEQRGEYRYSNGIRYGVLTFDTSISLTNDNVQIDPTLLTFNASVSFDVPVNNIDSYLRHSQIYDDGLNFNTLLFGKVLGTNNEDSYDVEIQYNDIDLSSHILNTAYRLFHLTNNNFALIKLQVTNKQQNSIEYQLQCYNLIVPANSELLTLFKSKTYMGSDLTIKYLNNEEPNVLTCVDELFEALIDDTSINKYSDETIKNNYTLDCTYDTVEERLIRITDASLLSRQYAVINDLLYYSPYNIAQYITAINNDLTVTYPNLLKYYSNHQFNANSNVLKQMIVAALYKKVCEDNKDANVQMKVPAGTTITYVSNVENALQIYYTDDIYIFMCSNDQASQITSQPNITAYYDGYDKTVVYNIYTKYNTLYKDLIDGMIVYKKYTLPYIDDSHLWCINDSQTSIYASGESAGNPNILIIETVKNTDLSLVGYKLNRMDIEQNILKYDEHVETIVYNMNSSAEVKYQYIFKIPKFDSKSTDRLKYATLFCISRYIKNGESYVEGPAVTTIWCINYDNDIYKFEPVKDYKGNILTLEDAIGLESYIREQLDNYGHTCNVLDDLIALRLPHTSLNGSDVNARKGNYFVISRNTSLPINDSESSYNFNVVEMKVANYLVGEPFSYANDSQYTADKQLLNLWKTYCGAIPTIQPYTYILSNDANHIELSGRAAMRAQVSSANTVQENVNTRNVIYATATENVITQINSSDNNSQKFNEYIPIAYVPIVKNSNVMIQDNNIINRSNLYSFDKNGTVYYSYIGSSCKDNDKSVLHIGSYNQRGDIINMGTESLISSDVSENNFMSYSNTLSIDMHTTYADVLIPNTILNVKKYEDTTVTTLKLDHLYNIIKNGQANVKIIDTPIVTGPLDSLKISYDNLKEYVNTYYDNIMDNTEIINEHVVNDNSHISINKTAYVLNNVVMFSTPLIINIIHTPGSATNSDTTAYIL